ncbi:zinc-ribbon domain-containing protein [Actinacidiphila glaucinigra]|uniref:zinc-ribbon domain-containing protein n=1 Tax=Actinacidiphila glaucinigra TaxID=235986 RepID=UPI003715B377
MRFPAFAEQFDPALNAGLTPDRVLAGTREAVTWRCPAGPDHIWSSGVVERTASGNGCPFCAGRRASVTNHLASRSELVAEFDFEANAPDTPHTLAQSSRKKVWWSCSKGPDHRWQVSVAARAKAGHGCPFCAGHRVSVTNSLLTRFPEAAAQLDPAANDGLTADQVTATVPRLATWRCAHGHTWQMTVKARTRALATGAGGCPHCYPFGASLRQLAVASALAHSLPGLTVNDRPAPIRAAGRPRHVDITIPELRLVLEYDGGFYHAGRELYDGEKSNALREAGWQVVRLREPPLDRIDSQDLPVPVMAPAYADELVPEILSHLRSVLDEASAEVLQRQLAQLLPDERAAWQWMSPPPLFLDGLQALEAFAAREGHALPASEHVEGDFRLGKWVMRQRRLYRDGKLSRPEQQMLERRPTWSWDWREHCWGRFLTALTSFADREGHLQVPQIHREGDYPLGSKVAHTRGEYRRGRLSPQRQAELMDLLGWTWEPDRRRRRTGGSAQLKAF